MGTIVNVFNPSNELVKVDLMDSDKETPAWPGRKPISTVAKLNKSIFSYNFLIKSIEISLLLYCYRWGLNLTGNQILENVHDPPQFG